MPLGTSPPAISNIRLYPIKSLNPVEVSEALINRTGGLLQDRVWALYASDGRWINGKRSPAVHLLRARFAANLESVELSAPAAALLGLSSPSPAAFAFPSGATGAAEWLSAYFAEPVTVRYSSDGFPDDDLAPGPTIVSTASLEAVSSWFPQLSVENVRLRFRANLEIQGFAPFEEDRLFAANKNEIVRFAIGEVQFEGSNPCARCAVPPRDPCTAESIPDFQKRFATLRQANLPAWSPVARFDHFYRFAVNTRVPSSEAGKTIRVGDGFTLR